MQVIIWSIILHNGLITNYDALYNLENVDNDGDLNEKLLGNRPIPIVVATEEHSFELDEEALAKVLLDDSIKDKKVAVISVAGAFRKGKSFLLDFFLRYLDRKVGRWTGFTQLCARIQTEMYFCQIYNPSKSIRTVCNPYVHLLIIFAHSKKCRVNQMYK